MKKEINLYQLVKDTNINQEVVIKDEINDKLLLEDTTIRNSKFQDLGINCLNVKNSKITQSVFEDCYMRNAQFHNVDLTGTKFIKCNLEKAQFRICTFRYAEFSQCKINIDEILGNLPQEANLKISILKQLLINQNEICDKKSCDKITLMIAEAEKDDFKQRFLCKNSYYNNLSTMDRLISLYKYSVHSASEFIWGYGLKISRLFRFALLSNIIFALIIYIFKLQYVVSEGNICRSLNSFESMYLSYMSFLNIGYGSYIPATSLSKIIFCIESAFGFIFLGFLVSAIYRRIAR